MKTLKTAVTLALLCVSFYTKAEECTSNLINWSNYNQTLNMLKAAYHDENFTSVESALACLTTSKKTFSSGKPGSIAAYWFFRNELPAPGADEADAARIKKWESAIPNSPFSSFAKLREMYAIAWNYRGSKYANMTSDDQFKLFKYQLIKTEKGLLSESNEVKDSAISYNLLLAVSLDITRTHNPAIDIFEKSVKKWPNHYDFYEVLLTRLVPKWGGSWEEVDKFINYWSSSLKKDEENSMYARLYYNVHSFNRVPPSETLVEWRKLKPSLISLYNKYPAQEHFEAAASYACFFSDKEFYKL
ncbi:hypothetical protein ONV78_18995, partial [Hahella sp. CR1]|uniref:hypothetical protein n=1 Tax=Hahella sp. CR1 TaxID=2992807 RepID=UPI002442F04F